MHKIIANDGCSAIAENDGVKLKLKLKKVIYFGGWTESTEPATYQRCRDAVKPANREKFANNVMKFLDDH